jgi:hypothetical protein
LWTNALFDFSIAHPTSWNYVNIKKQFMPKLQKCLKDSAYGAPISMYENWVKFVSIFPFFHLSPEAIEKQ